MNLVREPHAESGGRSRERALSRIVAEIVDGLRHGYFEFRLTCDVIGHDRRRLILHAGKSYQFVIPEDECVASAWITSDMAELDTDRGQDLET